MPEPISFAMPPAMPLEFGALPGRASVPATSTDGARVLLVSTYELGHQPIGLASPAAALRGAGHEVRTLDLAVDTATPGVLRDINLVAISVPMHTAARIGLEFARAVRVSAPDLTIVCYGMYASPLHAQLTGPDRADLVIGGEYEGGLLALAGRIAGRASEATIPGAGAVPLLTRLSLSLPMSRMRKKRWQRLLRGAIPLQKECQRKCGAPTASMLRGTWRRRGGAPTPARTARSRPCTVARCASCSARSSWQTSRSR